MATKYITAGDIIHQLSKLPPNTRVFVDWDREGANENEASEIVPFYDCCSPDTVLGVKIK